MMSSLVPRGLGEKKTHAAPVSDASKGEARADESAESVAGGIKPGAEDDTGQHHQAGGDADLALE